MRLRARDGAFRAPARVTFFFVKRKLPKKTTQTYGLRIPWRGEGFAAAAASRCCACGRGMGRFVPRHE